MENTTNASAIKATCLDDLSAFSEIRLVSDDNDYGRFSKFPQVIDPWLHRHETFLQVTVVTSITGLPKVIWNRPHHHYRVADLLTAAVHNHSTIFARWPQCAWPSNTWFLGPTWPTTPNGLSVKSAIFPQYMLITNGQNKCGDRPVSTKFTIHSTVTQID